MFAGVVNHLDADFGSDGGFLDRLVVDLDGVDRLGEVARVADDVDRVAHVKRPFGQPDSGDADLAEIVGYLADGFFTHSDGLLFVVRAGERVTGPSPRSFLYTFSPSGVNYPAGSILAASSRRVARRGGSRRRRSPAGDRLARGDPLVSMASAAES